MCVERFSTAKPVILHQFFPFATGYCTVYVENLVESVDYSQYTGLYAIYDQITNILIKLLSAVEFEKKI